jgi:hypothetical protein
VGLQYLGGAYYPFGSKVAHSLAELVKSRKAKLGRRLPKVTKSLEEHEFMGMCSVLKRPKRFPLLTKLNARLKLVASRRHSDSLSRGENVFMGPTGSPTTQGDSLFREDEYRISSDITRISRDLLKEMPSGVNSIVLPAITI